MTQTKAKFVIRKSFKAFLKMKERYDGLTQKKLAEEIGYKEPQVSQILSGEIEPSMRFLHRLSAFTKFGLAEILETKFS